MRHRRAIIIAVLVVAALTLGVSLILAANPTPNYDTNQSGMIERDEAHNALRAYFDGDLTQEQALDVLFHYWAAQPVDQPPPVASSQPTPVSSPTPTATLVPMATPIPIGDAHSNSGADHNPCRNGCCEYQCELGTQISGRNRV